MFKAVLEEIKPAYGRADDPVQAGLWKNINVDDMQMQLAVPLEINLDEAWAQLPLDPGKREAHIAQWVVDYEGLLNRNKEEMLGYIQADVPNLQEHLEEMAERIKNIWRIATEDQKSA